MTNSSSSPLPAGKLKELGNMFLSPFGVSCDQFKMVKDPATGSYTLNFAQK